MRRSAHGGPSPEGPDAYEPHTEAPAWLVDLAVVLGIAVVGRIWLIDERRSEPEAPAASSTISVSEATDIISRELGPCRRSCPMCTGPLYTADSVFIDRTTGETLTGASELEDAVAPEAVTFSHSPVRTTPIEVAGNVAVYGTTWGLNTESRRRGAGIVIVTFDEGKISRDFVMPMEGVRATDDLLP
jgi:hypothetical protein